MLYNLYKQGKKHSLHVVLYFILLLVTIVTVVSYSAIKCKESLKLYALIDYRDYTGGFPWLRTK